MVTESRSLVEVRCRNPLCPFVIRKGTRQLVGRICGRAELRCPSCRKVQEYDSTAVVWRAVGPIGNSRLPRPSGEDG
jgi:hypothetical protein